MPSILRHELPRMLSGGRLDQDGVSNQGSTPWRMWWLRCFPLPKTYKRLSEGARKSVRLNGHESYDTATS